MAEKRPCTTRKDCREPTSPPARLVTAKRIDAPMEPTQLSPLHSPLNRAKTETSVEQLRTSNNAMLMQCKCAELSLTRCKPISVLLTLTCRRFPAHIGG